MHAPPPHDTHEIVIAATLWLMRRYRQTRCSRLAGLVEQHLRWMEARAASPQLAAACRRLSFEWRALTCTTPPQPTLH